MRGILKALIMHRVPDNADQSDDTADYAVCDIRLAGNKGSDDQCYHNREQHDRREIIFDGCEDVCGNGLLFLAEDQHHDRNRCERAQFDGEEDAGLSIHPEETRKIHLRVGTKHNGRRISDQCCGALQIGRNRDGQNHRNRVDLQFFADGHADRRDHEDGRHIVNEGGDNAGEKGHENRYPHDVRRFVQKIVGDFVRHFGRDEEVDDDHGAGNHHEHVPVDGGGNACERRYAGGGKDYCGNRRDIRTPLRPDDHDCVHRYKEDNCCKFQIIVLSFVIFTAAGLENARCVMT